jgi:histidine triad (HIT) family protein
MAEGCVFCEIVAGRRSAHVVLEDELALGFLDVRPLFPGHVLVVPRDHHETLTDLPEAAVGPFFTTVQAVTGAVRAAMDSAGTFVAINNTVSQSVPHLHAHVVPRNRKDGLRGFFWPRQRYESDEHAAHVAAQIAAELARSLS